MQFSSHILIGGATAAISVKTGLIGLHSLDILAVIVGSMLPDIDHPHSALGRRIKPISVLISRVFGHRGITHSLFAIVFGMWILLDTFNTPRGWATGLALGYLSHLAADFLTPAGVPLLWPLKRRFCAPFTVVTGSRGEQILVFLIVWGVIAWLVCQHYAPCAPRIKYWINWIFTHLSI